MNRLRIVLDTNVLISAALNPQRPPALVVHLVALGAVELFVSPALLTEYREVFSRPKFGRLPAGEVSALLTLIEREATMVSPTETLSISPHESDNRFYECASEAQADFLVTGNARHFTEAVGSTKIITARQFLELVGKD